MGSTIGRRAISAALLFSTASMLAGCTLFQTPNPTPTTQPPTRQASTPDPVVATQDPEPPDPDNLGPRFERVGKDLTKRFGSYFIFPSDGRDQWDYDHDVIVSVDDAGTYTLQPADSYGATKASHYQKYKITVMNRSISHQKPALFSVVATDGDRNVTELLASDSVQPVLGKNVGRAPEAVLRPSRTAEWFVAFPKTHDVQIVSVYATIIDEVGDDIHAVQCHFSNEENQE